MFCLFADLIQAQDHAQIWADSWDGSRPGMMLISTDTMMKLLLLLLKNSSKSCASQTHGSSLFSLLHA
jgi:hypothetical protein